MTDTKDLAERWLETPGARSAIRAYNKRVDGAEGDAYEWAKCLLTAEIILIFLKEWMIESYPDDASHVVAVSVFEQAGRMVR